MDGGVSVLHINPVIGKFARQLSQGARAIRNVHGQHIFFREFQPHRLQHFPRRFAAIHDQPDGRDPGRLRSHQTHDIHGFFRKFGTDFRERSALVLHHH